MRKQKTPDHDPGSRSNKIPLSFEKAVEGLLSVKPKKKTIKKEPSK